MPNLPFESPSELPGARLPATPLPAGRRSLLSLVVPVFNEEETIALFHAAVRSYAPLAGYDVEIIFVNDGSRDRTPEIAGRIAAVDPLVTVINLSRNFGKEPALFAGLEFARGDAVIPIDVDLQDPIDVLPQLLEKWRAGSDVVLAKRTDRSADGTFKRRSAALFYRLNNAISDVRVEENVGDFRLMSRRVVEAVRQLPERKLFMKGILAWVGFETSVVEYRRAPRSAGTTKFNPWKLWNLALEGITSFSSWPLRIWSYIGFCIAGLSFAYAVWMVIEKLRHGNPVPGYPSLMVAILFLGGVQLIGIGVLGEYIGRIYMESKGRPRYIVRDVISGSVRAEEGQSRKA